MICTGTVSTGLLVVTRNQRDKTAVLYMIQVYKEYVTYSKEYFLHIYSQYSRNMEKKMQL